MPKYSVMKGGIQGNLEEKIGVPVVADLVATSAGPV